MDVILNNAILKESSILIEMYLNGDPSVKNDIQAYKWAYIVNYANNKLASSILGKLSNRLSDEEVALASSKAEKFIKTLKK